MRHVTDRAGHDRRYSLDASQSARAGMGTRMSFERGLRETVGWYQRQRIVVAPDRDGGVREYYNTQYAAAKIGFT